MTHIPNGSKVPDAPKIGALTVKMVDGILWLFDGEGRYLDQVTAIQLNQAVDAVTTVTVTLYVDMPRDEPGD